MQPGGARGGTAQQQAAAPPGQLVAFKPSLLAVLQQELSGPGSPGQRLWENGRASHLLADGFLGGRTAGQLGLIETPEALADSIGRARSQNDAKRCAHRCIEAAAEATRLVAAKGVLAP